MCKFLCDAKEKQKKHLRKEITGTNSWRHSASFLVYKQQRKVDLDDVVHCSRGRRKAKKGRR
jgi:hypothetical protein